MDFRRDEAQDLLDFFGDKDNIADDEEMTITVTHSKDLDHPGKGLPGYGLYACYTEYPEEGCVFLGRDVPCCDNPGKEKCDQCQEIGIANPLNH